MQNRTVTVGWQENRSALECNLYMLENQLATDVCFEVEPQDGGTAYVVGAHKFVLVSRSPVFEAMLCGGLAESSYDPGVIKVTDVDPRTFKDMLTYLYTDSSVTTLQRALPLLYAAKKYMLAGLVRQCTQVLENNLSEDSVCTIIEQSRLLDETDLTQKCLAFIGRHTGPVFKSEAFFNLSRDGLQQIVEFDQLKVESEAEVFRACIDWARRKLEAETSNVSPTFDLIRETLGNVLYKIRFPTMSPVEFADIMDLSNILTPEEQKDICFYFITRRKPEPFKFDARNRQLLHFPVNWFMSGSGSQRWNRQEAVYLRNVDFNTDIYF